MSLTEPPHARQAHAWPEGESELAACIRRFNWGSTTLGPIEAWPDRLKGIVDLMLGVPLGMILLWGDDLIQIYNDGYRQIMGDKHPEGLGQPTRDCWPEVWTFNAPIYEAARLGIAQAFHDQRLVIERDGTSEETWWDLTYSPLNHDGATVGVLVTVNETSPRVKAEAVCREVEARQTFLLKLSDVLRPLTESGDIERRATRLLGEHLQADRCFLSPVYEDGSGMCVREEYLRAGASSVLGDYTFAQFGDFVGPELHAGRILAVEDVDALTGLSAAERASYAATEIMAYLLVPLVRGGRLAAFLTINPRTPRPWSEADKAVARQTADRLWAARERGRAEAALSESEERFRSFADNSADTLWISDVLDGRLEYLSPAYELMFGESRDPVMADVARWGEIVHPDDRAAAAAAMPKLRTGVVNQVEYRIVRPSDGAVRWIQDTGFPIRDEAARVVRLGGVAQDVTERRVLEDRQRLLLAELQHRVRNTLGVIRSIARRSGATAASVEDYAAHLDGRLSAFARVQSAVTRDPLSGVALDEIVGEELLAYGAKDDRRVEIGGPQVRLSAKPAETLALAIHELATNAVKYGALSDSDGRLKVTWAFEEREGARWLRLEWREWASIISGAEPTRRGFGTELLKQTITYDLKAETTLAFTPGAFTYVAAFPLAGRMVEPR